MDKEKGITLIALVITVIVLLILSGVAIQSAINSDGLFGKTTSAKQITNQETEYEAITMAVYTAQLKGFGILTDENLNNELKLAFSDDVNVNKIGSNWYYKGYVISENGSVNQHSQRLPIEYQEVEYIETDGNCYIDTNVTCNNNSKIKAGFRTAATLPTDKSTCVFFAGSSSNSMGFAITSSMINGKYRVIRQGTYDSSGKLSTQTNYVVYFDKEKIYLDNNLIYTSTNTSFTLPYTMPLLAQYYGNNTTAVSYASNGTRLYFAQIWNNDTLIRDFIPCYRKSDEVIGLYDLIGNTFYTNSGSGTFNKGLNV